MVRGGARTAGRIPSDSSDPPARCIRIEPGSKRSARRDTRRRMALRERLVRKRPAMMFRTRLLLIFTTTIVAAVGLVELLVLASTRETFERAQTQRAGV